VPGPVRTPTDLPAGGGGSARSGFPDRSRADPLATRMTWKALEVNVRRTAASTQPLDRPRSNRLANAMRKAGRKNRSVQA
jgi:hypothetical protein